ncbi:hypothetical protein I7I53_02917 [Histoplasma capsulatum var. duboisii H88]|uniref:Protein kinase domain-containing protein n=1 Tax=Ajellomyces capsulatus (strain H88) TaxID=544711 RepID=A0A8A1LT18_AJEC8|nr:hypothetical protein I7I53_02917 [Histoplasma capsulatum var. duboisii H88]
MAGRYTVLHKLERGGYSAVWAARDQREDTYVTIKICVAEGELQIMKMSSHNSCWKCVIQMLDHFIITGPNGFINVWFTNLLCRT